MYREATRVAADAEWLNETIDTLTLRGLSPR